MFNATLSDGSPSIAAVVVVSLATVDFVVVAVVVTISHSPCLYCPPLMTSRITIS